MPDFRYKYIKYKSLYKQLKYIPSSHQAQQCAPTGTSWHAKFLQTTPDLYIDPNYKRPTQSDKNIDVLLRIMMITFCVFAYVIGWLVFIVIVRYLYKTLHSFE